MAALLSSAMAENKSKEVTRSTCDGEPSHSEASQSQRNVQDISQTETVKHEDIRIESGLKIPQQHTRLDLLLSQIPKKAQHGLLMQCDLILTCIDANDSYIALGTNIGLTFLYNRNDNSVQRLKSEVSKVYMMKCACLMKKLVKQCYDELRKIKSDKPKRKIT